MMIKLRPLTEQKLRKAIADFEQSIRNILNEDDLDQLQVKFKFDRVSGRNQIECRFAQQFVGELNIGPHENGPR